ncbi:hypothetical protein HUU05_25165 [candidate division KSB1 bacterium]|nr:hypothetical protein [candidate division KSB1 bacterium]
MLRVRHLENDVTKALLNVFEHGSRKLLGALLQLLDIKQSPETFAFDFQITDTESYRRKKNRIMLSLISAATPRKSDSTYRVETSQPDACIFNEDTAILIEAKTQSPLIDEQVESHIKHYLGTAVKRTLTWEELSEKFKSINSTDARDKFLLSQFTEFLSLIGLAEFQGFSTSDFEMLGAIGKMTQEDYLDFKRLFHRKAEKFMALLQDQIKPTLAFKNHDHQVGRVDSRYPVVWSAFYFYDDDKTHVNEYPNINFIYNEQGMKLSLNAETRPAIDKIVSFMKRDAKSFDGLARDLNGFNFSLYYKYQYLPKDHFIWNLIPGYPTAMPDFKAKDALATFENFGHDWQDYTKTLFFEMENGMRRHPSGKPYSEKELKCARLFNKTPNYVIRIEKRYPPSQVEESQKRIVGFFETEILRLKKLVEAIIKQ